jgi:plasmid stabilization system protein ParE
MRRLIWTSPALADLRDIDTFLMGRSPAVATRTLEAIVAKAHLIQQFPQAGPVFNDASRTSSVTGTPYSLLYRTAADAVEILRIRPEREDWR